MIWRYGDLPLIARGIVDVAVNVVMELDRCMWRAKGVTTTYVLSQDRKVESRSL